MILGNIYSFSKNESFFSLDPALHLRREADRWVAVQLVEPQVCERNLGSLCDKQIND